MHLPNPADHTGRAVIVTGGTKGIGFVVAEHFLAAGADVLVCARNEPETLPSVDGRSAAFRAVDVRNPADVAGLVDDTVARFGRLDVLVNNAGIAPQGDTGTTTTEDFDRTVAINLRGAFLTCSAAWSMLTAAPSPRVVMTGSRTWLAGGNPAYSATKAGLVGLCRSVAQDLAPYGGTCNVVAPGPVDTPFVDAMGFGDTRGPAFVRYAAMTPLKRLATPQDIAEAVAFFASDRASFITGDILNVAGGLHLAPKL